MQALVKAFWEIALWRRSPADLPDFAALPGVDELACVAGSSAALSALFPAGA